MLTTTDEAVRQLVSSRVNERIDHETERDIEFFRNHPERIQERLVELDQEWDLGRVFRILASGQTLVGLTLGAFVNRKWLIWPAIAAGFAFMHALVGWAPPMLGLRRLGLRTEHEISEERCTLGKLTK